MGYDAVQSGWNLLTLRVNSMSPLSTQNRPKNLTFRRKNASIFRTVSADEDSTSSETSVNFYQSLIYHIPEGIILYIIRTTKFKTRKENYPLRYVVFCTKYTVFITCSLFHNIRQCYLYIYMLEIASVIWEGAA